MTARAERASYPAASCCAMLNGLQSAGVMFIQVLCPLAAGFSPTPAMAPPAAMAPQEAFLQPPTASPPPPPPPPPMHNGLTGQASRCACYYRSYYLFSTHFLPPMHNGLTSLAVSLRVAAWRQPVVSPSQAALSPVPCAHLACRMKQAA